MKKQCNTALKILKNGDIRWCQNDGIHTIPHQTWDGEMTTETICGFHAKKLLSNNCSGIRKHIAERKIAGGCEYNAILQKKLNALDPDSKIRDEMQKRENQKKIDNFALKQSKRKENLLQAIADIPELLESFRLLVGDELFGGHIPLDEMGSVFGSHGKDGIHSVCGRIVKDMKWLMKTYKFDYPVPDEMKYLTPVREQDFKIDRDEYGDIINITKA